MVRSVYDIGTAREHWHGLGIGDAGQSQILTCIEG
jgi:hypothetical protein